MGFLKTFFLVFLTPGCRVLVWAKEEPHPTPAAGSHTPTAGGALKKKSRAGSGSERVKYPAYSGVDGHADPSNLDIKVELVRERATSSVMHCGEDFEKPHSRRKRLRRTVRRHR